MESSNLTESPADNVTKLLLEVSNGDRNAVDLLLPVMNFVSLQRITANCYCRRDIHMMVAPRADGPPSEQVVLEVTSRTKAADETDVRNTQVANPGESTPGCAANSRLVAGNVEAGVDWPPSSFRRLAFI